MARDAAESEEESYEAILAEDRYQIINGALVVIACVEMELVIVGTISNN